MFGEFGLYSGSTFIGSICDNRLFIKPTDAGRAHIGTPVEAPPYPGARPSFLIEEQLEDSEWVSELVRVTTRELTAPTRRTRGKGKTTKKTGKTKRTGP